ncbi:MAG: endolytic transglycosylase MltG [Gemmatimonadota bacterium]
MHVRVAALVALLTLGGCRGGDPELVELTVPSGASFSQVVDTLAARDLVRSPRVFRAYARIRRNDRNVRSGAYVFEQGERWGSILDDLVAGRVVTTGITIPEGFTLKQMAERIAGVTMLDPDSVRARLEQESHERWDVPGPGLEGYLFPDTYRFASGTALETVIGTMVQEYRKQWTPERLARLEELKMSQHEISTLASIIEAEAVRNEEMPMISAVFHNRLRLGYLLQADPTVLYALGGHRPRLLYAAIDSVADNPYNTYTQRGLPPGPIGAFGERALEAALSPLDTNVLYFVARPDGTHIFTRSLVEHNRARVQVREEQGRNDH